MRYFLNLCTFFLLYHGNLTHPERKWRLIWFYFVFERIAKKSKLFLVQIPLNKIILKENQVSGLADLLIIIQMDKTNERIKRCLSNHDAPVLYSFHPGQHFLYRSISFFVFRFFFIVRFIFSSIYFIMSSFSKMIQDNNVLFVVIRYFQKNVEEEVARIFVKIFGSMEKDVFILLTVTAEFHGLKPDTSFTNYKQLNHELIESFIYVLMLT